MVLELVISTFVVFSFQLCLDLGPHPILTKLREDAAPSFSPAVLTSHYFILFFAIVYQLHDVVHCERKMASHLVAYFLVHLRWPFTLPMALPGASCFLRSCLSTSLDTWFLWGHIWWNPKKWIWPHLIWCDTSHKNFSFSDPGTIAFTCTVHEPAI